MRIVLSMRRRLELLSLFALTAVAAVPGGLSSQRLSLFEDLRVDGAAHGLTATPTIFVAKDGSIAVPQPLSREVVFFRGDGGLIARFGSSGQYNGWFANIGFGLGGWLADTLWIYDASRRRFSLLTTGGILSRSFRPAVWRLAGQNREIGGTRLLYFEPAALLDGGRVVGFGILDSPVEPASRRRQRALLFADTSGGVFETALPLPNEDVRVSSGSEGAMFDALVPFAPRALWSLAPLGGLIVSAVPEHGSGATVRFRVSLTSTTGATIGTRLLELQTSFIAKRVADSAIAAIQLPMGTPPTAKADIERLVRDKMPVRFPGVVRLLVGRDSIVGLVVEAGSAGEIILLDRHAGVIGRLHLPPRATPVAIGRDFLWVIDATKSGVPSLVRFRIVSRLR